MISSYFFNNFLRFYTEGYLEIFFGACVNLLNMTLDSVPEKVSAIVSGIVFVISFAFPALSFALLYDKRKEIQDENPLYLKRFGTMYADFKIDKEWYCFQYYTIFLVRYISLHNQLFRRMIFVLFLFVFMNYPEIQ